MPQRLTKIFDDALTLPAERHRELAACSYQGDSLAAAEEYPLCAGSTHVTDDEHLARAMESPSHVKAQELEFTQGAFLEATKRGVSVQRLSATTPDEIHKFGNDKVARFNVGKPEDKCRTYLGYVAGLCSMFRTAQYNDQRLFAVFSTPLPDTPSHADIFVIVQAGREEKAAIQQTFWDAFDLKNLVREHAS